MTDRIAPSFLEGQIHRHYLTLRVKSFTEQDSLLIMEKKIIYAGWVQMKQEGWKGSYSLSLGNTWFLLCSFNSNHIQWAGQKPLSLIPSREPQGILLFLINAKDKCTSACATLLLGQGPLNSTLHLKDTGLLAHAFTCLLSSNWGLGEFVFWLHHWP